MQRNRLFSLSLIAVMALVLTACGGGAPETGGGGLAEKKAQLTELKTQRKELNVQIKALQEEIKAMDSTNVKDARVPVRLTSIKESTFEHFVKVQGQIEANKNVMVSPKMGGVVTAVYVREGQSVKKGQVLAKLDDSVLQKSLLELETQLTLADTVYRRQKNLWEQNIGSEIQVLQAQTQKESLERRIATTQEQVDMTRIKAPLSGTVDRAIAKVGEAVSPGFGAFNIINLNDLSFKADLSESYIPYVKKGNMVTIEFPSIGKKIEEKVSTISKIINPVNRTVSVEVRLDNRSDEYKANMVGEVSIQDIRNENVVVIPISYIQESASSEFVMVAERNEAGQYFAKRVDIVTGNSYQGNVEVTSGLKAGMQLIIEGAKGLAEGAELLFLDNE